MTKYMVLRVFVFDYPYEEVKPCEYNGKTVFDNVEEAKNALAQSVLDFINERGFGLKDLVNMITHEKVWFRTTVKEKEILFLEVGNPYINSEQNAEWRITKVEI